MESTGRKRLIALGAGGEAASVSVSDTTHRYGGVGTRRTGMLDDLRIR